MKRHQNQIAVLISVLGLPVIFFILSIIITEKPIQTEMDSIRTVMGRGSYLIIIRPPIPEQRPPIDISFFNIDEAPAIVAKTVAVGPASGTATSPDSYQRRALTVDEQLAVTEAKNILCSSNQATVQGSPERLYYEVGINCSGYRTKMMLFDMEHLPPELVRLLNIAQYSP